MSIAALGLSDCRRPRDDRFDAARETPILDKVTSGTPDMATVEIYASPYCGYCHRAKRLLQDRNIPFEEIDVVMDPKRRQEMVQRAGGAQTVPQIFINGRHIGGSDQLAELDRAGQLQALLDAPENAAGADPA
ncbi:Glutaredoxin 3 (modular protein) [uncultured Defluviicoccus sp.]|nr:Glutaredoxin 3 (modular protein) [uncultured Defluviicoccus sp.]